MHKPTKPLTTTGSDGRWRFPLRAAARRAALLGILAAASHGAAFAEDFLSVAGCWSGYASQRDIASAFTEATGLRVDVNGGNNKRGLRLLAASECDVLIWSPYPSTSLANEIERSFPDRNARPSVSPVGQFAVYVVVNRTNTVQRLGYDQLRGIFEGSIENWSDVGSGTGKITLVGELPASKSHEIVTNELFDSPAPFAKNVAAFDSYEQVAAAVARDPSAIGYCLFRQQPVEGVKVVAIGKDDQGPFYLPTEDNVFSHRYPLAEELFLIIRADARKEAKAYCRFAAGPEGTKIAKKWFLYPEYDRKAWTVEQRLAEVKSGKGAAVSVMGPARGEMLVKQLALKYVEEEKVVQVHYRKQAAPADAARAILDGKAELMLLDGAPETALPGELVAGLDKKCKRAVLGQAALGVVVHPKTLLKSLSVDELRQVFCGRIKNWPSAGKGAGPAIHGYGLRSDSAVMEIYKRMLGKGSEARGQRAGEEGGGKGRGVRGEGRALQLTTEADTAKVVLAVARDPDGIGLVDLSQMPKDDKSVTLLAIDLEKGSGAGGQGPEKAMPVAGDVPEDYPLVRPCVLYVSPAAGDAAKNFFAWLASAGSNADRDDNGGADNDRAELLARFGLLPPKIDDAAATPDTLAKPDIVAPAGDDVATLGKEPQIELEEPRAAGNDSADTPRRDTTAKNAKGAKKKKAATAGAKAPAGNRTAVQPSEPSNSSPDDAAAPFDAVGILLGFAAVGGIVSVVVVSRVKRRKPLLHAPLRRAAHEASDSTFLPPHMQVAVEDTADETAPLEKTFDPYHVWLSIPPDEQPANHYRLLGLAVFESDREVVEEAADRQMAHLRTLQLGQFAALSQGLLNEVSAAKGCLLSPTKKPIYDAHLRRRLAQASV